MLVIRDSLDSEEGQMVLLVLVEAVGVVVEYPHLLQLPSHDDLGLQHASDESVPCQDHLPVLIILLNLQIQKRDLLPLGFSIELTKTSNLSKSQAGLPQHSKQFLSKPFEGLHELVSDVLAMKDQHAKSDMCQEMVTLCKCSFVVVVTLLLDQCPDVLL